MWSVVRACAVVLGAILAGCVCGCASSPPAGQADYVLVYLKTGPRSAEKTADERKAIFEGHMGNIHRLADEGKLVIAGPFGHPRDTTWRGIFVLDTPKVEEARQWAGTDPGVRAGVFAVELRPLRASVVLRQTAELEKQLNGDRAAKPTDPPPNVRGYVMVTASDYGWAARAIGRSPLADKVVWRGRCTDLAGGGVFVLDAKDVKEVETEIGGPLEVAKGMMGLDGWWSSACLERLPREVRE